MKASLKKTYAMVKTYYIYSQNSQRINKYDKGFAPSFLK